MGIVTVLGIGFLLSNNKRSVKWRTILGGLAIQVTFAFIALQWNVGAEALQWITFRVQDVIDFANEGIGFLFGALADGDEFGNIFAFHVLPIIIFFSSLISVLYYLGIMQWLIKLIGGALSKLLGTSKAESMSAAANIFVGQTEAPLVVRPFLPKMTQSELFAVMTGGLASVAGSVLVGYHLMGVPLDYLLAAAFMAAPGGLIMAKMIIPETEKSETADKLEMEKDTETSNVIDAAARGASEGLKLALNVGAMLIAFVALIALLNGILNGVGGIFGFEGVTIEGILGVLFAPFAFAIGVPWEEAMQAGSFIGQKITINEFVAFASFSEAMDVGELSDKSILVLSFALCGFANFSSLAILIGGIGGMAPNRRADIAKLGIKAVIAGTLASLLSASIAGMFF
ncbi:NupC/NupG family nucleoside CNT transporter [Texcoconibacillus texcoconensis]|uniref:Nucleoside permease n=1 Tax=Texcoconibacillus texcoconensis TaxID=1095777 RepID=A0A840QQW4_9BACI|nr:NupC/NupG family nucleoside CNT transporter [Texcoconibacillus texcoconensis]MBB5173713.1 CNT family concentrative nucleoside transporter [Texcoconibacillus texcoconensis]